uniref:Unknown protein 16 (Fragments) n=1 Tax=Pseudotsuga menziesii TaxID=3357 RepID=UP16_PSEMZ|nr:RecName: Full=Unknown protein 16 [Pseudotsuga menziesii]
AINSESGVRSVVPQPCNALPNQGPEK